MNGKIGNFEWILNFEDIELLIVESVDKLLSSNDSNCNGLKTLVIGCGTSKLSESIANISAISEVVSIDNDNSCIEFMKDQVLSGSFLTIQQKTKWYCYDVVEDSGNSCQRELSEDGYFDILVDKGTFDAILVEKGSVVKLLKEVHRLLKFEGVYILISINQESILRQLLSPEAFGFECTFSEVNTSTYKRACTVTCKKLSRETKAKESVSLDRSPPMDIELLLKAEKNILDENFKLSQPLFTQEDEAILRRKFSDNGGNQQVLLTVAHKLMFESSPTLLDYTFDLFLEDLEDFSLEQEGFISVEEAIIFLQEMQ